MRRAGDACFDPERNPALKKEIKLARRVMIPTITSSASSSSRSRATRRFPSTSMTPTGISDAYLTVSGQNSNNSVSLKDDFCAPSRRRRLEADRPQGRPHAQDAEGPRPLGEDRYAAWASADPGLHFNTTMNDTGIPARPPVRSAHRTPARSTFPRRHGLQPGVAEPAAVLRQAAKRVEIENYEHAVRLWTMVLEISVTMAQFPSKEIAQLSYEYARSASATPTSAAC